ncbi:hypothetical protein [Pedobacter psychrodurus]|uniref:hypothetical protein n=1 Tax=Pedobacter psychrodurus TaxID=2530456 RepID=UPI00292EBCB2|nr:hypothetical protein [Pedobacter psychrodurus]
MFSAVSVARKICGIYGFSFRTDISGSVIFDYNGGLSEYFGKDGHLIAVAGDFWSSSVVNLNIVTQVFICSSAMEAVAFLHFNPSRFTRPDELLFIAIGPDYHFPGEILKQTGKVQINLLLGGDLIENLRTIKFCMDYRGIAVHFTLGDEMVFFKLPGNIFCIPQQLISLRRFFLLVKIRPFFRQYVPKSKISFLHEFMNQ